MVVVLAGFTLSTDRTIKMIGLGMAAAILVDALIVRTVLVPAIMHTLGRRNWYLPSWLDRWLPHLEIQAARRSQARRRTPPWRGAPNRVGVPRPNNPPRALSPTPPPGSHP